VKDVHKEGFTAMIQLPERFQEDRSRQIYLQYFAYQINLHRRTDMFEGGTVDIPMWQTGSRCVHIQPRMGVEANFFVSTEHSNNNPYDASNSWVEHPPHHDGAHSDKHPVRLCTRELQNFDGYHEGMSFNWLSYRPQNMPGNNTLNSTSKFDGEMFSPGDIPGRRHHCYENAGLGELDYHVSSHSIISGLEVTVPQQHIFDKDYSPYDFVAWTEKRANGTDTAICYSSVISGLDDDPIPHINILHTEMFDELD